MRRDLFYRQLQGKRQLEERIGPLRPLKHHKRRAAKSEVILLRQSRPQRPMTVHPVAVIPANPFAEISRAYSRDVLRRPSRQPRIRGPHIGWRMATMPGSALREQQAKQRALADEQYRRTHRSKLTETQRHPSLPAWLVTISPRGATNEGTVYLGKQEVSGQIAERFIKGGTFPVRVGRIKKFQTTGVLE